MHPENQLCAFLNYSGVDAWRVIEIPGHGEFLLVFQTLAIYVDLQGRKSRDREIMYPALPTHISELSHELLRFVRRKKKSETESEQKKKLIPIEFFYLFISFSLL